MKAEADIGVMHLQVKGQQGLLGTTMTRFSEPAVGTALPKPLGFPLLASRTEKKNDFVSSYPVYAALLQQP